MITTAWFTIRLRHDAPIADPVGHTHVPDVRLPEKAIEE